KTIPPIPHVSVKHDVPEAEKEAPAAEEKAGGKKKKLMLAVSVAAGLISAVGGYVGVRKLLAPKPPPPAAQAKGKGSATVATPPPKQPVATPGAGGAPATAAQPTPSDPLNKIAHAPKAAINKAQDAIAVRKASGQTDLGAAAGEGLADKPAVAVAAGSPG